MPPSAGSRFGELPLLEVTAPDGTRRRVVGLRLRRAEPPAPDRHRLIEGEQIDLVARRALGGEGLWWRILDANPVVHPFDLRAGDVLALPAAGPSGRVTRARSF